MAAFKSTTTTSGTLGSSGVVMSAMSWCFPTMPISSASSGSDTSWVGSLGIGETSVSGKEIITMAGEVAQSDGYEAYLRETTDPTEYAVKMFERYMAAHEKMENAERELRVALVMPGVDMQEYHRRIGEKYV